MPRASGNAHRAAQQRLSAAVAARLGRMLVALPDPTAQEAMDVYNRAALGVVGGAQRRAVALAFAYAHTFAPARRPPSVGRALAGVVVSSDSAVTRSPVLRVWGLVAEGAKVVDAVTAASSYAGELSSLDLQAAQRGGLDEGVHASGERIVGWQKELGPSACDWCELVAGEHLYSSADSVPFHSNDTCSVSPVLAGEE